MNERAFRPGNVAAAAVLIGGLLLVALPQHGLSIIRLVVVTVAAAALLYALTRHVPEWSAIGWGMSPFSRTGRPARVRHVSGTIDRIRSKLSGRRQPLQRGPPLPPEVLRLLRPLIEVALEREGLDPGDEAQLESARARLSPLTWAVLTSDPLQGGTPWHRTRRPSARQVAEAVHGVLDDLDRLNARSSADSHPAHTRRPRGT